MGRGNVTGLRLLRVSAGRTLPLELRSLFITKSVTTSTGQVHVYVHIARYTARTTPSFYSVASATQRVHAPCRLRHGRKPPPNSHDARPTHHRAPCASAPPRPPRSHASPRSPIPAAASPPPAPTPQPMRAAAQGSAASMPCPQRRAAASPTASQPVGACPPGGQARCPPRRRAAG